MQKEFSTTKTTQYSTKQQNKREKIFNQLTSKEITLKEATEQLLEILSSYDLPQLFQLSESETNKAFTSDIIKSDIISLNARFYNISCNIIRIFAEIIERIHYLLPDNTRNLKDTLAKLNSILNDADKEETVELALSIFNSDINPNNIPEDKAIYTKEDLDSAYMDGFADGYAKCIKIKDKVNKNEISSLEIDLE